MCCLWKIWNMIWADFRCFGLYGLRYMAECCWFWMLLLLTPMKITEKRLTCSLTRFSVPFSALWHSIFKYYWRTQFHSYYTLDYHQLDAIMLLKKFKRSFFEPKNTNPETTINWPPTIEGAVPFIFPAVYLFQTNS